MSSHFQPGKVLGEITAKTGETLTVRFIDWSDLPSLLQLINELSSEDTYIRFSGEQVTLAEEAAYLASVFVASELGKMVKVVAMAGDRLVGVCDIRHLPELKKRGEHVGRFGLIIAKDWRGKGLGEQLSRITLRTAQEHMPDLKLVTLECFAANTTARNLYKKLGFTESGRWPEYVVRQGEFHDEVQMYLRLDTMNPGASG